MIGFIVNQRQTKHVCPIDSFDLTSFDVDRLSLEHDGSQTTDPPSVPLGRESTGEHRSA